MIKAKKIKLFFDSDIYISIFATPKEHNICVNFAKVAQLVEHDLAKVGVASSNLVFRSKMPSYQKAFILKLTKPMEIGSG